MPMNPDGRRLQRRGALVLLLAWVAMIPCSRSIAAAPAVGTIAATTEIYTRSLVGSVRCV